MPFSRHCLDLLKKQKQNQKQSQVINMKSKVLLFHPPNILNPKALRFSPISPTLCGYGLLHIGTYLKRLGYAVECWNIPLAYKMGLTNQHLEAIFKTYNPIAFGIELNWLHLSRGALDLAALLKKLFPNVPIIMGGVHATLFAREIIKSYDDVDVVVKGEGERIMEDLVDRIEKGLSIATVRGIVARRGGKILETNGKNIIEDIDRVPPYIPNFLKPDSLNPYNLALINTCRGPCSYQCVHCVGARDAYCLSPRKRPAFHSADWVVRQIQILLDYVKELSIQDYSYCNPKFLLEFSEAIRKEKLQDEFKYFNMALAPIPPINAEIFRNLARAGVGNVDVGIESGSDYILQRLRRPYNTAQASRFLKTAVRNGIVPKTYWMITGFERREDLEANWKLLDETIELGSVPRWVTELIITPGTSLFKNAEEYDLNLRFSSFEDYMRFSTEKCNRNARYPNLITHSTPSMSVNDILKAASELKSRIYTRRKYIIEKLKTNEHLFRGVQPKLYEVEQYRRVRTGLKYIRRTFF